MWTWLKELWTDKSAAQLLLRALLTGAGVYVSTPHGRSEWERVIPAALAAIGVAIPSSRAPRP